MMIACTCALVGCGPSATDGGFESANPAARMYAIEQAARENDRSAIPCIIEQLDCDDPAVRLLAITTLERMTGQTYGYRHYDDAPERRAAIARWEQAEHSGEIDTANRPMNSNPATKPGAHASETDHAHQG